MYIYRTYRKIYAGKRYPVTLPDGGAARFSPGAKITKIKVFAGKGTNVPIRNARFLEAQYHKPAKEWKKVRGESFIVIDGKNQRVELHWYEAEDEKFRIKAKRNL